MIKEGKSDTCVESEYDNQLEYLNNSVEMFKDNLAKGAELHKIDNWNSIKENINLIWEILKLRWEIKSFKLTERVETITMRKEKKLRNIVEEDIWKMDLS